jgi:hypothetical protein
MTAPHPDYLVRAFPLVQSGQPIDAEPTPLEDVEASFVRLRARGDQMAVWDGGKIPPARYTGDNVGGGRAVIHIQGVQRLQDGKHYVLSGGDKLQDVSHVFVARVGTEGTNQPFGSTLRDRRVPPQEDKVVNIIGLRNTHWHAGGISVLGDVLAVPVEAGEREGPGGGEPLARILFLHLRDPSAPEVFPSSTGIECRTPKAGATALTRLPNGHFLCAVWSDKGGLEFYVSHESDTFSGFGVGRQWDVSPWRYQDALGGRSSPQYQSIGFLWQAGAGADPVPRLYLVGTGSTSQPSTDFFGGFDYADLFRVELPPAMIATPPVAPADKFPVPTVTRIREARFTGGGEFSHMAAGGGVYVSSAGLLCVYGAYHWRLSSLFRMCEYRSELPSLPSPDHCWLDLFEHDRFRGRRLSVVGTSRASIADYETINVQGDAFNDKVSSARWHLPTGSTYRLFRERNFRLSGNQRDFIDLAGTGKVEEIRDFSEHKASFGDCVSSSKFR